MVWTPPQGSHSTAQAVTLAASVRRAYDAHFVHCASVTSGESQRCSMRDSEASSHSLDFPQLKFNVLQPLTSIIRIPCPYICVGNPLQNFEHRIAQ